VLVSCLEPKIFINKCTYLVSRIGGVGYKVFLHLRQTFDSKADDTGSAIEASFGLWKQSVGLGEFICSSSVYVKSSKMPNR
jgi:hypothetical protein